MLESFPKYVKGRKKEGVKNDSEIHFESFNIQDQKAINDFIETRTNASDNRKQDYKRELIRFRQVINKPFDKFTISDLQGFMNLVNKNIKSGYTEKAIKQAVRSFLMWRFKDYSERFDNFRCIEQKRRPLENRQKDYNKVVSAQELKKLVESETDIFWKSFLLLQAETGLRTIEVREMKWKDLTLSDSDEPSEVKVFSTKTQRNRYAFFKEATSYLKNLKEGSQSEYVFPSPMNKNKPITKASVCLWIKNLSKRVLGEERIVWSYLFRHTKATELYKKVEKGELDEGLATKLMGHSSSMREVYSHIDDKERKNIMKQKLFGTTELTPEKKDAYEQRIKELETEMRKVTSAFKEFIEFKQTNNPKKLVNTLNKLEDKEEYSLA